MYYKTTSLSQQVLALLYVNNPKDATGPIVLRSQYSLKTLPGEWLTVPDNLGTSEIKVSRPTLRRSRKALLEESTWRIYLPIFL
jgi:hypothetical protein